MSCIFAQSPPLRARSGLAVALSELSFKCKLRVLWLPLAVKCYTISIYVCVYIYLYITFPSIHSLFKPVKQHVVWQLSHSSVFFSSISFVYCLNCLIWS